MSENIQIPTTVRTERLILRIPSTVDAPQVYEAIVESLPELRKWLTWAHQEPSLAQSISNAKTAQEAFLAKSDLRYYIFEAASGRFVGSTGLHRIDWKIPKFEIGFWVRTSYAGKGYVTEAVRELTEIAFRELYAKRVEIRCDERHMKCRSIAEKNGYRLEGILQNDTLTPNGELRNTAVFSKIIGGKIES